MIAIFHVNFSKTSNFVLEKKRIDLDFSSTSRQL